MEAATGNVPVMKTSRLGYLADLPGGICTVRHVKRNSGNRDLLMMSTKLTVTTEAILVCNSV
jgi:hypothetical protein